MQGSSPGTVPALSCSSSVTRGSSAQCIVTCGGTSQCASGVSVLGWQFADGSGNKVTRNTSQTSLSWAGIMVSGGTVTVTINGIANPLTYNIAVVGRTTFAFAAVAATKRTSPYVVGNCSMSLPTSPGAGNELGHACLDQYFTEQSSQVNDNGPNQGFWFVQSVSNASSLPSTSVETTTRTQTPGSYLKRN
jgi:hypothetical protein